MSYSFANGINESTALIAAQRWLCRIFFQRQSFVVDSLEFSSHIASYRFEVNSVYSFRKFACVSVVNPKLLSSRGAILDDGGGAQERQTERTTLRIPRVLIGPFKRKCIGVLGASKLGQ